MRALVERANAQLKVRFKALRKVSEFPWRIGGIVAAALFSSGAGNFMGNGHAV
ncbi:hypothetical protein [Streptosporangium canum]|uniref:hypothetical protein n=1 Tax=Streptosporangium canum TaxID=324952 RepID=UPI0015A54B3F|nr:hypothetical protein [Streptosporangium canum]